MYKENHVTLYKKNVFYQILHTFWLWEYLEIRNLAKKSSGFCGVLDKNIVNHQFVFGTWNKSFLSNLQKCQEFEELSASEFVRGWIIGLHEVGIPESDRRVSQNTHRITKREEGRLRLVAFRDRYHTSRSIRNIFWKR